MELNGLPSTVIPPPAVTLTFDLLATKSEQHICEPKYKCGQNWVKWSLIFEIWCSQGFRDAQTHALTHRRTDANTECLRYRFSTMAKAWKQFWSNTRPGYSNSATNKSYRSQKSTDVRIRVQLQWWLLTAELVLYTQSERLCLHCRRTYSGALNFFVNCMINCMMR